MRVLLVFLGFVISPAVVAFREDRDRIDMPCFERLLKLLFVELPPDIGYELRCVEIQVDLPER